MFVVDHAVVEAGGLDDQDAARRELEPGPERGPSLADRPPEPLSSSIGTRLPLQGDRM